MNSVSTRSRRARARLRRRLRKRKHRGRLAPHAVLFDQAGILRPLGEIESLLEQARASGAARTTIFRMARRLWQADHAPQLDGLRLVELPDISGEEDS